MLLKNLLLPGLLATSLFAADLFSEKKQEKLPGVRNAHAMVYHPKEKVIYLFGGADAEKVHGDLWRYQDNTWQKVRTDSGPSARTFSALTYDARHNRLLLFGGNQVLFGNDSNPPVLLNDTWTYQDGIWKQLHPVHTPGPRAEAALVYDAKRKNSVLFGGYTITEGNYVKLGDTWIFEEGDWQLQKTEGPTPRHGVAMTFDKKNRQVILFGGSTADRQYGAGAGETWTWDGVAWSKLMIDQPPGIFNATMVYYPPQKSCIRFGGWTGEGRTQESWKLARGQWSELNTARAPTARNHSAMVYHAAEKAVILFGGHDGSHVFGDTWKYTAEGWRQVGGVKPEARVDNGH